MRSRANCSASSVAASQAFTAASISAAVTRRLVGIERRAGRISAVASISAGVATRGHILDNGAGRCLDIGGNLALGGEELAEPLVEIGAGAV